MQQLYHFVKNPGGYLVLFRLRRRGGRSSSLSSSRRPAGPLLRHAPRTSPIISPRPTAQTDDTHIIILLNTVTITIGAHGGSKLSACLTYANGKPSPLFSMT